MNEIFWVSNYILQTCNKVLKVQQTVVTFPHSLENVKTVSKNVPKQLRKTVIPGLCLKLQSKLKQSKLF